MNKEHFKVNDLKLLYICLSQDYSVFERRLLADASLMRDTGAKPIIICLENSPLLFRSQEQDLDTIEMSSSFFSIIRYLKLFLILKSVFQEECIDIIHCYGSKSMWLVPIFLLNRVNVSLFASVDKLTFLTPINLIKKLLIRRFDRLFFFSYSQMNKALRQNVFQRSRTHFMGIGFGEKVTYQKKNQEKQVNVLLYCSSRRDLKVLRSLLFVIKEPPFKNLFFKVFHNQALFHDIDKLSLKVNHYNLSKRVLLLGANLLDINIDSDHVYIELNDMRGYMANSVKAIFNGVVPLLIRSEDNIHLLGRNLADKLTYKKGDLRELTQKLLEIKSNYANFSSYVENLISKEDLQHSSDNYNAQLLDNYELSFNKRLRFSHKGLKP